MNDKILIVDDEPRICESLKFFFEHYGLRVQTSANGPEAVEEFTTRPVKVVLADIQMPKMDGFDLFSTIKKIDPFVQFIFITGYANIENIKKAFQKDAFEFFKKPVDNKVMATAVKKAFLKYDHKKNEFEIKRERRKTLSVITKVFNSLEAQVYVADIKTHELIFTNENFRREHGYAENESLAGKTCWKVSQQEQTGPCSFCTNQRIVDENGLPADSYEWEFYNENTNKLYRVIDKAIEWIDGRIVRLETAYDITQKREHERLFKQFEKTYESFKKIESLGTLAGGIAHQFNNALSVITGHTNLMRIKFPGNSSLSRHLEKMQVSAEKMTQLTSSLLAFARGGTYHSEVFVLSAFIGETLDHLKHKFPPTINLITDFPRQDYRIKADKTQIQMLFAAIMENAVEAMEQIGTIKIVCDKEKIDPEKINADMKGEYVCVRIIDDGCGMDDETRERIFDPFFTTKLEGRGMGLSAAYGIVKSHQGYIWVGSKVGKGTTVEIFLPVKTVQKAVTVQDREPVPKASITILLIEDEDAVREVTKMMLEKMGHKVLEANTGRQAVNIAKFYKGRIHLGLLDFLLPDMNGDLVYPRLVKERPNMDIIVLSGYALTDAVQKILDDGAVAFMQKPVGMADLSGKINALLSLK